MRYKSFIESTTSKDDPKFKDLYLFHGKSAYQAAVEMGYPGTEEEWIESLRELRWGTSVEEFDGFTDLNKQYDIAYIDYVHGKIYRYDEEKKEFVDTEISTYDKEGNPIHTTFLKRSGGIMTGENPLLFEKSEEHAYSSNHIRFNTGKDHIGADTSGNIGMFASGTSLFFRVGYGGDNVQGATLNQSEYTPTSDNVLDLGRSTFRWKNVYGVNYKGTSFTGDTFTGKLIGNADTATKFASGMKIGIGGAVTSTPTAFDNSKDITIPITAVNPSYITQNASYRMVTDTNIAYWNAKPTKAEMNTAISTAIANLIDNSPDLLNTLDELAAALGDDPNFATTMTTELGKKVNKAGDTMTGTLNSRAVIPTANNSYNLGSASLKYANAYATTFHGALNGYATGAHCLQTYASSGGSHGTSWLLRCQYGFRSRAGGATFDFYVEDGTVHKVACDVSTVAATLGRDGNYTAPMTFNWNGQSGQPSWLWGGNDGANMYVYNPSNFNVRGANWLNVNNALTYGASGMQYFNLSMAAGSTATANQAPTADWYHVIRMNHSNSQGYYTDLAFCFHSNLMAYRRIATGTSSGWITVLDSGNYKSYALALTGGTVSGATTFSSTLTASGRFTANGRITVPSVGGAWISGMTLTNCSIQVSTQNSSGSYHPIIGGKSYSGHFWNIGTIVDTVGFYGFKAGRTENAFDWKAAWEITTGNFTNTGTITGSKVFNPVWNDYAEWYEKEDLEETFEPGDIVTWGEDGVVKTTEAFDPCVVGVYSDTYGHIVGGKQRANMEDNVEDHVPVGLCGRVHVKVVGKAKRGDLIVSSDIPGVGMAISPKHAYPGVIIGKVLKNKDSEDIEKIKIQIMLQ